MKIIFCIFVLLVTDSFESKNFNAPKTSESFLNGSGYQPFVVGAIFDMKKGTKLSELTRKRMREAKKGKTPKNIELFKSIAGKYTRTEAQNKARSESYKKKGIKPPSRKGSTPWNKGKTGIYTEETKKSIAKKVSEYLKMNPINFTEEVRRKIGESKKREKSTFWKGGVSANNRTERENIMSSFEYQSWRRKIFERDDYTCQMHDCGKRGGKIRAHHIKKFAHYPELRLDLRNGIVICEDCDCKKIVHREKKWEKYFFDILKGRKIITAIDYKILTNYEKK